MQDVETLKNQQKAQTKNRKISYPAMAAYPDSSHDEKIVHTIHTQELVKTPQRGLQNTFAEDRKMSTMTMHTSKYYNKEVPTAGQWNHPVTPNMVDKCLHVCFIVSCYSICSSHLIHRLLPMMIMRMMMMTMT